MFTAHAKLPSKCSQTALSAARVYIRVHPSTMCPPAHTHTHTHIHTHTHTTRTCSRIHYVPAFAPAHSVSTRARAHAHTHSHTHTHTHAHAHAHAHTHLFTHPPCGHLCTRSHCAASTARPLSLALARARAHTHTHTHRARQVRSWCCIWNWRRHDKPHAAVEPVQTGVYRP
jgi:hypothetical protein